MVSRQLQADRRTGSAHRPKTGVLPTVQRYQPVVEWKMRFDILNHSGVAHECDRRTDGQTEMDWQTEPLRVLTTRAKIMH